MEATSHDEDLRIALAGLHAEAGNAARADRVLAQARPQDDRVFAARLANVATKSDPKLLKRIERALLQSEASEVRSRAFLLGQLYELRKEPDLALSWYAQEPAGGAWAEAQLRRGVLLARDKQDVPGARSLLAELRRRVDDADQRVDAWLLEAELLTPVDRQAAGQVYDEALAQNGQDVRLLYSRALFRIGDDDVAGLEQDLGTGNLQSGAFALELDRSGRWRVEPVQQAQQRRLPGARWAGHDDRAVAEQAKGFKLEALDIRSPDHDKKAKKIYGRHWERIQFFIDEQERIRIDIFLKDNLP